MTSKVSIIMAAYNAQDFLGNAIKSVQGQTHENWELLIVDDLSSDNTLDVACAFSRKDPRIRVIASFKNGGPAAARNKGLKAATGQWITVLDSDDRYVKNRLETLLTHAEEKGLDIVADNQHYYDHGANLFLGRGFFAKEPVLPLTPEVFVRNDFPPRRFPFGLLKPFIRADFLRKQKVTYPEDLRFGEDFSFLFSLLLRTDNAALVKDPLYVYTLPLGTKSRQPSGRSRTDRVKGWGEYQKKAAVYRREAAHFCPMDDDLMLALGEREKRIKTHMAWNAARDSSRKFAFLRRWFVALNPGYSRFVFLKIRDAIAKKHPLWTPKQAPTPRTPPVSLNRPLQKPVPAMALRTLAALPAPAPIVFLPAQRLNAHDPRAWKIISREIASPAP